MGYSLLRFNGLVLYSEFLLSDAASFEGIVNIGSVVEYNTHLPFLHYLL